AILWIQQLKTQNVTFEMDCKSVVHHFMNSSKGSSIFYSVLNKCIVSVFNLSNSRMSFIERQVNLVVHNLIKTSRFYVSSHVFRYISSYII
ncbi:hypothetical protein glysoja_036936, partial [Glycine soja]